jgi:hypothetical protein
MSAVTRCCLIKKYYDKPQELDYDERKLVKMIWFKKYAHIQNQIEIRDIFHLTILECSAKKNQRKNLAVTFYLNALQKKRHGQTILIEQKR